MSDKLAEAREALTGALDEFEKAVEAISTNPDADTEARCSAAEAEVERRTKIVNDLEKIAEARKATPVIVPEVEERTDIKVGREEATYRPDTGVSFFRDLAFANQDGEARERLNRHNAETRNVSSASNGFIPPVYLAGLMAEVARPGRPFANALPKADLPQVGTSFTVPRLATGVTVAAQTDAGTVSETDATTNVVTTYVRTIAGQQDISQQLLDRSEPAFDQVIFRDLVKAYDADLDRQLISGVAVSNEHVGIASVSSINTVTYTSSTPTGAELLPKIYDAAQKIASNRYQYPTHIVMHPRRAAALAASLGTSFPIFQQGGLFQAAGTQDGAFVGTIAGLPVIADANVTTTSGTGTNQDEIYLVYADDLVLMEGEMRFRTMEAPLSATLEVRLQAFGYSAFLSERYPKGIAKISGTGLATPSF
jgi:HK97 family phage major capsid protein